MSALRVRFSLSALRGAFRWLLLFCRYFSDRGVSCPICARFAPFFFIPCYDSGEVEERQKEGTEKKKKFLLQSALRPMGGREREGFPHRGAAGKGRRIVKFF